MARSIITLLVIFLTVKATPNILITAATEVTISLNGDVTSLNVSLDTTKPLEFECDVTPSVDLLSTQYYKDGQLAANITSLGKGVNTTYVLWRKEDIKLVNLNHVTFKKISLDLEGVYTCAMTIIEDKTRAVKTSKNDLDLRLGAKCKNELDIGKFYEDERCMVQWSLPCTLTYPKPQFKCEIINSKTKIATQSLKSAISISKKANKFINAIGKYNVDLKGLNLQRYDVKFRCQVLSGLDENPKLVEFPSEPLSHYQCPKPKAVKNAEHSISRYNCFGYPDEGSILSYKCDKGWKINGPQKLYCKNGKWSLKYSSSAYNISCVEDMSNNVPRNAPSAVCTVGIALLYIVIR